VIKVYDSIGVSLRGRGRDGWAGELRNWAKFLMTLRDAYFPQITIRTINEQIIHNWTFDDAEKEQKGKGIFIVGERESLIKDLINE
jgi:hypothetical protein